MSQNQRDWTTQARQMMVREQLQARCITDSRVLEVMGQLPRERFVPPAQHRSAYDDRALPIGFDQTISQPYMVAIMTEALKLQPNHRVLEVGTGSGYQTAVLARLASHVYTIERIQELADQALQRLEALGITNVSYRVGDGSVGWAEQAPFDRILLTAAAPSTPEVLIDQLVDGGLLVLPVGGPEEQILTVVQRQGQRTVEQPMIACRFVKLIGQAGWPDESYR